jgi:spermidine synthase
LWLTFFGAGFAGLVLQIVWVRVLSLVFGASNYAISTVLAAYMAGLALGGFYFGRRIRGQDTARVVRTYARLLAGIGISGFLVTILAPLLGVLLAPVLGLVGWNSGWAIMLRGLFGFLILLVPATLLGGLVPLASQLAVEDLRLTGSKLAGLYFVNTAGSVLGALAAGFFLLEQLGVVGTAGFAALVALALCGISYRPLPGHAPAVLPADDARAATEPYSRRALVALAAVYGLSGFAGLGYEVVWARALATILGHPLYAVTIVTAAFLSGLALGGLVFGRLSDRWRDPLFGFGVIESTIAGTALLTLVLVASSSFGILEWVTAHSGRTWSGTMLGLAGFCFLVVFAPTFLMGATFPVAAKAFVTDRDQAGLAVGWLYAANSAGALLGSIIAGFALVPALGASRANLALAGISLTVAVVAALSSRAKKLVKGLALAVFSFAFVALALVTGAQRLQFLPPDVASNRDAWQVLYYRESSEGVVLAAENPAGDRQMWVNSSVVCGSALPALKPVRIMGVVPFCLHENPQDVLVIGYGLGVTASLLVGLSPKPVDCVEISPGVVAASRAFSRWNNAVYASPNLHIMPGDGRNYLLCTRKSYDIISCDPTHPSLGSGALYTRGFYQLCRKRLRPGGILTLHLPFHLIRPQDFRKLLNTFRTEFPQCALWLGIAYGVLVGRKDAPIQIDYQRAMTVFARLHPALRSDLHEVFIDDAVKLLGSMLLDSVGMAAAADDAGVATDDQPGFEYAGARAGGAATWAANAELVVESSTGPMRVLLGTAEEVVAVQTAAAGTAARFRATIATMKGDRNGTLAWFRQAVELDHTDREAARFLLMAIQSK